MQENGLKTLENPPLLPFLALELIQMLAKVMQAQVWAVKIPVLVYKARTAQAGATQTPQPHHLYQCCESHLAGLTPPQIPYRGEYWSHCLGIVQYYKLGLFKGEFMPCKLIAY